MKKENCFYLGKIVKPFSYKGELILFLDVDDINNYTDLKFVYIDINNRLIKYDIDNLRLHGNKIVVSFKDITIEETAVLVGKEMYLPLEMLPKLEGNQFYFHEVIGYNVIDKNKGNIGIIKEFIDNVQPIMVIHKDDKEILIPVIDQFITNVDRIQKIIYVDTPNGLIDIYLN